jgi:glucoamylase
MGVALGRYPEDKYNGYNSEGQGNPWFLITNGLAEFYYKASKEVLKKGEIRVSSTNLQFFRSLPGLVAKKLPVGKTLTSNDVAFYDIAKSLRLAGDAALRRTRHHGGDNYSMSEQLNRNNGFMQGAEELTWSHASFITASSARN